MGSSDPPSLSLTPAQIQSQPVAASCTVLQSQKEVTAYLKSKQLLPFGLARRVAIQWLHAEEHGIYLFLGQGSFVVSFDHCCSFIEV